MVGARGCPFVRQHGFNLVRAVVFQAGYRQGYSARGAQARKRAFAFLVFSESFHSSTPRIAVPARSPQLDQPSLQLVVKPAGEFYKKWEQRPANLRHQHKRARKIPKRSTPLFGAERIVINQFDNDRGQNETEEQVLVSVPHSQARRGWSDRV